MNKLIIIFDFMKKEEKSTPISNKTRSVYKYELQATNQILQDTLDIYPSSLHSTARTRRYLNAQLQSSQEEPPLHAPQRPAPQLHTKLAPKNNQTPIYQDNEQMKLTTKSLEEGLSLKESQPRKKWQKMKKQEDFYQQIQINSQIYQFSPENLHYSKKEYSCLIDKEIENQHKKDSPTDNRKEMRKQRRGLANISLKVKNIVAKRGKMTFKQVSDQVLKQSQQDLPPEHQERQKQTKNIRRRVYDALNVLVSVGILGKQQRCVVHTQFTNIPGKKLSSHWQIITQKNRILEESQTNFNQKQQNLIHLKKKYQYMLYLRGRNVQSKTEKAINQENQSKADKIITKKTNKLFHFPLVVIIPPKLPPNTMTIQIDYEERANEIIKKFQIKGNELLLTDFDLLKYLKLSEKLKEQQICTIKGQIKGMRQLRKEQAPQGQRWLSKRQPFQNIQDIYLQD